MDRVTRIFRTGLRRRLVVLAAILAFIGAVAGPALAKQPAPPPDPVADVVEIGMGITPGKPTKLARPGEWAEKIVARKVGGRFVLEVARNVGSRYQTGKADLSAAEWNALTAIVAAQRLRSWRPDNVPGELPPDCTSMSFWIKGKWSTTQTISQPVSNPDGPTTLGAKLGALTAAKVPALTFYYFTY